MRLLAVSHCNATTVHTIVEPRILATGLPILSLYSKGEKDAGAGAEPNTDHRCRGVSEAITEIRLLAARHNEA